MFNSDLFTGVKMWLSDTCDIPSDKQMNKPLDLCLWLPYLNKSPVLKLIARFFKCLTLSSNGDILVFVINTATGEAKACTTMRLFVIEYQYFVFHNSYNFNCI